MDDFTKKLMAMMFASKNGEGEEGGENGEGGEGYGKKGCGKEGCPMKNGGWETTKARLKAAGMEDDEFEWLSPEASDEEFVRGLGVYKAMRGSK